jgi:hypothetical protein
MVPWHRMPGKPPQRWMMVSWIAMIITAVSSIIGQDLLRAGINFIGREDIGFDSCSRIETKLWTRASGECVPEGLANPLERACACERAGACLEDDGGIAEAYQTDYV